MRKTFLLVLLILTSQTMAHGTSSSPILSPPASLDKDASAADCAGFKRLSLGTAPGLCSGLVASRLGFVRGVAVAGDEIWIADMGGWRMKHGRLLRIKDLGKGPVEVILSGLDEPNSLA